MPSLLHRLTKEAADFVARFDPDCMTTAQVADAYRSACELERYAQSIKVLAAPRAADATVWTDEGHRSAAEWMAAQGQVSVGDAVATLETGRRLRDLDTVSDAVRNGELSASQAKAIAQAAAHRPESQEELLEASKAHTMAGLKAACRRVLARRASAAEENERYNAIHARRCFRHWSDADGAFCGEFTLTPDAGARLLAAVEARANHFFDEARKAGREEPAGAYRADALVDLVAGARSEGSKRPRTEMTIVVSAEALQRGHVEGAETCEIRGVGPVPVATAREALSEAFLKLVVTKSQDIATVCHAGRTIPASLRTALEVRDPICVVPGCDTALGLEIDHFDTPFAGGGETRIDNLARLCRFHHRQKTYSGYELKGAPGAWVWEPPEPFESPSLVGVGSANSSPDNLFDSS